MEQPLRKYLCTNHHQEELSFSGRSRIFSFSPFINGENTTDNFNRSVFKMPIPLPYKQVKVDV